MGESGSVGSVAPADGARRMAEAGGSAPLLVDVRERSEFEALRVPGAVLVPLSEFGDRFESLPRDRPLLVMCAAGRRSLVAATHLAAHGYTDVTNVEGGIIAWRDAGLPTTDAPPAAHEGELPERS